MDGSFLRLLKLAKVEIAFKYKKPKILEPLRVKPGSYTRHIDKAMLLLSFNRMLWTARGANISATSPVLPSTCPPKRSSAPSGTWKAHTAWPTVPITTGSLQPMLLQKPIAVTNWALMCHIALRTRPFRSEKHHTSLLTCNWKKTLLSQKLIISKIEN